MPEHIILQPDEVMTFWDKHRLSLLLIIAVLIALVMTAVSMIAYNASGTAQLDLSRPGYSSVSDKVDRTDRVTEYSGFGSLDKDSINEFIELYDAQAEKTKAVDAFNGDPLNPEILESSVSTNE